MKKKYLERSIVICSLALLFLLGLYLGTANSYSINVEENLTDGNVANIDSTNDNIMYLYDFNIESNNAKAGDKLNIKYRTEGATVNGATLQLIRNDGKYTLSMVVQDINNSPYIILPDFINTGDYIVKSLLVIGNNSDGTTFSKNFTNNPTFSGDTKYNFNNSIHLEAVINNVDIELIESIDLKKTNIFKGSKLYIDVKNHKDIRAVRLNFVKIDDNRYTFYSYINSINNKPYLLIPSSAASGEYYLDNIYIETYNYGSVIYTNRNNEESKYLEYHSNYNLIDENSGTSKIVYYNNEDIDSTTIQNIRESNIINEVHIMAEDNSIISEDIVNLFRNTNKKLIGHYKDITYTFNNINNVKAFDASVKYETITSKNNISKIISDGIIMTFSSNGELPGETKVTIDNKELINRIFNNKNINIYYYHEDTNKFETIKEDVTLVDNKIEFNINHTSSYIITNSKVNSTHAYSKNSEENKKDEKISKKIDKKIDKKDLILIIMCVIVIVLIILVLLLLKNNKTSDIKEVPKEDNKDTNEEELNEEQIIENISKANDESFDDEEEE